MTIQPYPCSTLQVQTFVGGVVQVFKTTNVWMSPTDGTKRTNLDLALTRKAIVTLWAPASPNAHTTSFIFFFTSWPTEHHWTSDEIFCSPHISFLRPGHLHLQPTICIDPGSKKIHRGTRPRPSCLEILVHDASTLFAAFSSSDSGECHLHCWGLEYHPAIRDNSSIETLWSKEISYWFGFRVGFPPTVCLSNRSKHVSSRY